MLSNFTCKGMLGLLTGGPAGCGLGIIWTDGLLETTWFPCDAKFGPIKSALEKK